MLKSWELGNCREAFRRDYIHTKVVLQKSNFSPPTVSAIDQRSLLWVPSQLPRAHDEPALNEGRQTGLPGKEKFKKLTVNKKE